MAPLIQVQKKCSKSIQDFLTQNVIGTPIKSMVYQQLRTSEKLYHIPNPYFALLTKSNTIIATCCFCERKNHAQHNVYIRYFSFRGGYRSSAASSHRKKESLIRNEIQTLLTDKFSLGTAPVLFYAYLDLNNVRSARLCQEFEFNPIRAFSTLSFSRLVPHDSDMVTIANETDKTLISTLLKKRYAGYHGYTEENLFYEDSYFVLKNNLGEIIAGVQGTKEHWKIHALKGKKGASLIKILSRIPVIKKFINADFHFVAFDYCYFKKGNISSLERLLEAVLKKQGVHAGIITADNQSELYIDIKSLALGPMVKIKKEVNASVIARYSKDNYDKIDQLSSKPWFISTLDLT